MCNKSVACKKRRELLKLLSLGSLLIFPISGQARSIHLIKGDVRINSRAAAPTSLIKPGDNVETGPDSKVIFVVDKDAYYLRENSRLSIIEKHSIVDTLRIFSGKLLAVFASGKKKIQSPVATMGIRGTGTYTSVSPGQTYFCTCYGEVDIAAWQNKTMAERVVGTHHAARMITTKDYDDWKVEPAPFVDHTDEELIMLEALVGRKPEFIN